MKKVQSILLAFTLLTFAVACESDGGTSVITLQEGAVPSMVKSTTSPAIIDLNKVNDGEPFTLDFNASVAQGNPASSDIIAVYKTVAGPVYSTTLFSNVQLPQDFTLTTSDIVAAFSELNNTDDIKLGDVLTISIKFTMPDGRVLNIVNPDGTSGTGTNIQTTALFTTVITYPVSCPSNLGGNHSFVATNLSAPNSPTACPTGEVTGTVTWTDQGGGTYLTSDLGFGQYPSSCWSDTPATSAGATFTEICGEIISGGADQYGLIYTWVITEVDGSWLTMTWSNNYADSGTVVITREGGADWPNLFTTN